MSIRWDSVPTRYNYVAINSDGMACGFRHKPFSRGEGGITAYYAQPGERYWEDWEELNPRTTFVGPIPRGELHQRPIERPSTSDINTMYEGLKALSLAIDDLYSSGQDVTANRLVMDASNWLPKDMTFGDVAEAVGRLRTSSSQTCNKPTED